MQMSISKLPLINEINIAPIDESDVIPTVMFYQGGKAFIGREAREKCPSPELLIEDFKIELGKIDADNPVRRSETYQFNGLACHASDLLRQWP
jgi:hypothetical protein